jgi:hypothetical protein
LGGRFRKGSRFLACPSLQATAMPARSGAFQWDLMRPLLCRRPCRLVCHRHHVEH